VKVTSKSGQRHHFVVLTVVAGGLSILLSFALADIWWTDDNLSTSAGAVALRAWFRQVWTLVESRPEYEALPEARGGYA
jgi:hypothetical protein